ncbi:MAG: shikimate kinase AroK [Gammaproteobacteria bacterium]
MKNKKNIIFIGPMGAGKTTIGRLVAKRLDKDFYDSDHEIESRTGADIPWIFEIEGEEGFRKRETTIITELCELENIVLSTGGGVILSQDNCKQLKDNGIVIYLKSSAEKLLKRIQTDKRRPLLQTDDKLGRIRDILKEREPMYESLADEIIMTDRQTVNQIVKQILNKIKKYEND